MEVLNPFLVSVVFFLGLMLIGWIFLSRFQAILLGLKGMKIEERAKEISRYLNQLEDDFSRFREDFGLVGKHLGHAQSTYQNAEKRLDQFAQRLVAADAEPTETLKARFDGRDVDSKH